ncbi:Hypothetical_protein [Hexamita inflata]|uniref:Hypothetical_protein n=1 Tax=Hexamita inflata TaxID=28002 RepID=A0AA86PF80_9EUKA|nr:Hypothetical protein HINF_LOCUS25506 [Hexamita inflata]CAI9937864.1 Hypothetical protein HINF_LOCUS25509 [Hexamita inflata]
MKNYNSSTNEIRDKIKYQIDQIVAKNFSGKEQEKYKIYQCVICSQIQKLKQFNEENITLKQVRSTFNLIERNHNIIQLKELLKQTVKILKPIIKADDKYGDNEFENNLDGGWFKRSDECQTALETLICAASSCSYAKLPDNFEETDNNNDNADFSDQSEEASQTDGESNQDDE